MHPLCTFQLVVWLVASPCGGVSQYVYGKQTSATPTAVAAADGAAAGAAAAVKGAVGAAAGGRRGYSLVRVPPVIFLFTQVTAPGSPQPI